MSIAPKQDLRLFRGSLDSLKLKPIEMHIAEEITQHKPTIQVLQKKPNNNPLEIDGPLF